MSEPDAIGTPEGAPVPEVPAPEPAPPDAASITLEDVQNDPELSLYIASADRVMDAMGYTEHGFRHANLVANIGYQVLHRLDFTEREAQLACVAGYLHDVGNALARDAHGQTGGVLVYQSLRDRVEGADLMPVIAAIANHEEAEGTAVSPISAAVILADKSDVHRSRVRKAVNVDRDIHDRVNYAVTASEIKVSRKEKLITLELAVDTEVSPIMEYFEIFLPRMMLSRRAAEFLHCNFALVINNTRLL